jgi:D-3-phosphoglycerate dehydrogenase
MKSVLITEPVHELLPQGLQALGFEVVHLPEIQRKEVLEIIHDFEGIIINSKIVADKELITAATKLKFVARCGSGKEVMDIPLATSRGIECITSPEGNRQAVAEQTLGMLLCIMNNVQKAHNEIKNKQWIREANRGHELFGKTVGIIGYGNTGEAFAKVLAGFNVKVLAHDKYSKGFAAGYINESSLKTIFEEADVVSLHLPLTSETKHFANDDFFNSFKKEIWFLNTSRGVCVETKALINALENGKVVSAALDVLENEKINSLNEEEQVLFEKLIANESVLLTPHIAGWTHESKRKIAEVLLEKISKLY